MQLVAALIAAATFASPESVALAKADYAQQLAAGEVCRYVDLGPDVEAGLPVVQFVAVLASREPLIDGSVPGLLPGTGLVRIKLNRLRWSVEDWKRITGYSSNPHTTYEDPLIVPAGWFVDVIADGTRSDAYLRLYFGGRSIPATRDQFLRALGVDAGRQRGLAFGLVEGQSRVNLVGDAARLIRHDDGIHSEAWTTFDVRRVEAGKDPLEALNEQDFEFDASEIFGLSPKVSSRGIRGLFPVMALANGAGKLVAEAPIDIVEDSTRFAGQAAIRSPGSCIQCHVAGPQRTSVNALRERLLAGVELLAKDQQRQLELELFHLGEVDGALDRWQEWYEAALVAVNGLTPEANAKAFAEFSSAYHADVGIERAAAELAATVDEVRHALAYAAANKINLGVRLAGLAHDRSMPRSSWESDYLRAREALNVWRQK